MQRHEIIVVGAGIAGAATAWHLRRLGVQDVLLIEKERAAGEHSTGLNAAILREHLWDPHRRALAEESAAVIRTGELAEFRPVGGVIVGDGDDIAAADRMPLADGRGRWRPNDGVMDPAGMLQTFLRGQRIEYGVSVTDWASSADGIRLRTTNGEYACRVLVNAAGPWAGTIGRLPLVPRNRHIYLTGPMPEVDRDWPYVWDDLTGVYFRPDSGGLLMCPCDEEDRSPGDYRMNADILTLLAEKLTQAHPQLAGVSIRTGWTGQRTFAPDRQFVIGYDTRFTGLFHVCGLGGHGITTSCAVGRLAADLLLQGPETASEKNPFSPARLFEGVSVGE